MAKLQKFVVVLLVLTIVLSSISVIFNIIVFKMSSENSKVLKQVSASYGSGNIGLIVEGNNVSGGAGG